MIGIRRSSTEDPEKDASTSVHDNNNYYYYD